MGKPVRGHAEEPQAQKMRHVKTITFNPRKTGWPQVAFGLWNICNLGNISCTGRALHYHLSEFSLFKEWFKTITHLEHHLI